MRILHLFPGDMTFREEERLAKENKIKFNDRVSASIMEGKTVFRERRPPAWKFWKKRRSLAIYLDGMTNFLYIEGTSAFHSPFGTLEDIQRYIAGEIAKTKSKQKPMEMWEFVALMIGLAVIAILQLKSMGYIGG